jgi:hypothetical protein
MFPVETNLFLPASKKVLIYYIWGTALYGSQICELLKVDKKCLESFEMWCWKRMDNINCDK